MHKDKLKAPECDSDTSKGKGFEGSVSLVVIISQI